MKIDINLAGAGATPADYDMVKAALVAAQAATPTARAARATGAETGAAPAFADLRAIDEIGAALADRFAGPAAGDRP